MRAISHPISVAVFGLCFIASCGKHSSHPPSQPMTSTTMPSSVNCAAPELNRTFAFGSEPLTGGSAVAAAFDGGHVWVAVTKAGGAATGLSVVHLTVLDCAESPIVQDAVVSSTDVSRGNLALALGSSDMMLAWNVADATGVTSPHVRTFPLSDPNQPAPEVAVPVSNESAAVQGSVVGTSLVARPGGFYLAGEFTLAGEACPEPFIQPLDDSGGPMGGAVDVYAGGLGACANGIEPFTVGPGGTLYLSWLSTRMTSSGQTDSSVNSLQIPADTLAGTSQIGALPKSQGVQASNLLSLGMASAQDASITSAAASLSSEPPWTPQYLAYPDLPTGATDEVLFVTDLAQPFGLPSSLSIPMGAGQIERPMVTANAQGGTLAWTLVPPSGVGSYAAMYAQRFAYDGIHWNTGNLQPLLDDGAPIDRHLRQIVPVSATVFFMVWTEGTASQSFLYGAFVML